MLALLIILTFVVAILIDHLLTRRPIPIAAEAPATAPQRPRLIPSIVAGFEVPDNVRFHPGHTWALAESPELVRVGIDDFAARLAGGVTKIDIPERGQWIRQGQRIIAMHHNGREIDLVSPIEGTVSSVNTRAIEDPTLAQRDPYGDGWLLTVSAPDAKTNFRNLLGGNTARRWMDEAAARLRAFAVPAGALAQDGGVAVTHVIDQLPDADWDAINKELFLA
ncbi:MAG TPA: glycine cleavage system protein H [Thermoanaerobaculia bacterium]|nr:glycine cleavage system protein H [Thermoanaerobaculia bacterium]